MSDEDEKVGSIDLARPEEEALRLKTLAEEKYTSGNLKSAVKYAKRAHKLHPSLDGLSEMLTAFKILRTAAKPGSGSSSGAQNSTPDYYKILQVEPFSHINTIKKQYKKLALALHPDKNPFVASEEAFKLVAEASRVLSDKIRRKEYDLRLRISMQSKAAEEVGLGMEGSAETFWTACSTCRLLHQFGRKYLGHNLMCPRCKKTFKATEVEEDSNNGGHIEMNEGSEAGQTRVSTRIRERVAKGGNLGIVEKCGLGVKRKISSVGEVLERSRMKMARKVIDDDDGLLKDLKLKRVADDDDGLLKDFKLKRVEKFQKSGERDGRGNDGLKLRKVENLVVQDGGGYRGSRDTGVINELRLRRVGGKVRHGVEKASKSGGVETVESERTKRAKAREEETMTLSEMQMLVKKKKKLGDRKLAMKQKEVNAEQLKPKEKEGENEKEEESEKEKEERDENREKEDGKERGEEREKEKGKDKETEEEGSKEEKEEEENKEKEMVSLREKTYSRRVSKDRNLEVVKRTSKNLQNSEMERDRSSEEGNLEVLPVEKEMEDMRDVLLVEKEKEDGNEKGKEMADMREAFLVEKETGSENKEEKEMEQIREKRERRRVSKYGNLDTVKRKTSKNHVDSDVQRLITKKKGNLEIVPVEDSEFHDFDKDRRERSFKKGQVWAVYDDDDGMPRHYALIDEIVSVNPFEVRLSWLQFQNNGDDELVSWQETGFHVSCGSFKISKKVSIKYLNLFSHVVDCERAARQMYRIYPTKGTVWALYSNTEGTNQGDKNNRCYDIVVALSSYSDVHGLSIAHLEKVSGFRTVFKRREVGANAVVCLAKDEVKLFSHQIPAKKLSGEEASGLPKDCWELDPASLASQLLNGS